MSKKKIRSTVTDGTDRYLRVQRVRGWIILLAVIFLMIGGMVWLFFGSYNITVTGYAQILGKTCAFCAVPASDIDKVEPGMTVWADNCSGAVTRIEEAYYTYDQLINMYGHSADYMHFKENEVYYFADADIKEEFSGYSKYTIIIDTVTPFEFFFGGTGK